MSDTKLRFKVRMMVDGSLQASCTFPRISAEGVRLAALRKNVAAAVDAALGEPRPFTLMVGRGPDEQDPPE